MATAVSSGIVLSSTTKLPRLCRVFGSYSTHPLGLPRLITVLSYRVLTQKIAEIRWLECDGTMCVKTLTNMHNDNTGQLPWVELVEPGEDVVNPTGSHHVPTCREPDAMGWLGDGDCWM
jgi:hypothetical protein